MQLQKDTERDLKEGIKDREKFSETNVGPSRSNCLVAH